MILTKINIYLSFDPNRHFLKFWPKSRIFDNFDHIWDISTIVTKINIFENFDQNRDFRKIVTTIEILQIVTQIDIFRNFDQNQDFGKILIEIEISEKVLKILNKIQVFLRFSLNLR